MLLLHVSLDFYIFYNACYPYSITILNKILNRGERMHRPTVLAKSWGISALFLFGAQTAASAEIEEIIVTAQKISESLQEVPLSVSAFSAEGIEALMWRSGIEISSQVPNMLTQSPWGDTQPLFSLRGVSSADWNPNQASPIGVYVDEVYLAPTFMHGMQLYDLERVEVLRGPQGTLYGKNTTGGAINFHTKIPQFETNGYLTATIGNFNRRELGGAFETVLKEDVLGIRAAFSYIKADGYVENLLPDRPDGGDINNYAARISLRYQPGENLDLIFKMHAGRSRPEENYGVLHRDFVDQEDFAGYNEAGLSFWQNEAGSDSEKEVSTQGASLKINKEFENLTLTSITAYDSGSFFSFGDDDGSPFQLTESLFDTDAKQFSQDLRISSESNSAFSWIAGLYYMQDTIENMAIYNFYDDNILGLDVFRASPTYKQIRTSFAGYFHSTYSVTDDLSLTLGLRYTDDKTELPELTIVETYGTDVYISVNPQPVTSFSNNKVTFKLGVDYHINDGVMVYANYSQGYRAGAINAGALSPDTISITEPEEIEAVELGIKSRFLNDSLQINAALFNYDYTNQQFLTIIPPAFNQSLLNAGESRLSGGELELLFAPTEFLMIQAGIGILSSEYKQLEIDQIDLSGNELIATPDTNLNLAVDYEIPLGNTGSVQLHVDGVYVADQFFKENNIDRVKGDAYSLLNAKVGFVSADGRYTVSLWAKNILNEEYYIYIWDYDAFVGYDYTIGGMPRTYGLEVKFYFK